MQRLRITDYGEVIFFSTCAATHAPKQRLHIFREDYIFNRTSNISLKTLKKVMVSILLGLRRQAAYCLGDIFNAESSALMNLFWKKYFIYKCVHVEYFGQGELGGELF